LIVILQSDTTQDVVFNFIAVAIISDFDNFVFSSLRNEPLKELVVDGNSEFMKVQFTTSIDARSFKSGGEASEVTDEYGEPMCLKICFWRDRTCVNKFLFLVYRVMRAFFTSIYFYFYPAISIMLCFQIPLMFRNAYKIAWVKIDQSVVNPNAEQPSDQILATAGITEMQYGMIKKRVEETGAQSVNEFAKGTIIPKMPKVKKTKGLLVLEDQEPSQEPSRIDLWFEDDSTDYT